MVKKIKRVYVDASAIGGKFNARLAEQTKPFWDAVERGEVIIILSDICEEEVMDEHTPQRVQDFFESLQESQAMRITTSPEATDLAVRYIAENVVGKSSFADCVHVAVATLTYADVLVSWNLKHLVTRSDGYKSVNRKLGYPEIEIQTPEKFMEVHGEKR